jgi:hypothetical protein
MAETLLRHATFCEGEDDRSVLNALKKAGFLPLDLDIKPKRETKTERDQPAGKEGMLKRIAPLVRPIDGAGKSAIAVRDFDDQTLPQIEQWFIDHLTRELHQTDGSITVVSEGSSGSAVFLFRIQAPMSQLVGRVVGIAVGMPSALPAEYGITQFAIDDFVLALTRKQVVYEAISEFRTFDVTYDLAIKKLGEVVALMKTNGIPVVHTKRLMHIFRAVTGFRAASATFAERVIEKSVEALGRDKVKQHFAPLITALEAASSLLSSTAT